MTQKISIVIQNITMTWGDNKLLSVVYVAPRNIQVLSKPVPEAFPDWPLIKVCYSGICGTDLNIYSGAHPRAKGPLTLGHEISGYLEEESSNIPKGTPVTIRPLMSCGMCEACQSGNGHVCEKLEIIGIDSDGGMAEYVRVPADMIYPLPDNIPLKLAALVEPFAVGVHVARESNFVPGSTVLIFGAGVCVLPKLYD